jgi:ATP-dependent RNA helicase RhlE
VEQPKDNETTDKSVSKPSFDDFGLNKQLLSAVKDAGFESPTEIQQKAIPLIMAGHDVFGIAQTGTGKTAAFILPILFKIRYPQGDFPRVLILAPTRELVTQISAEARKYALYTGLRVVELYGGLGPKTQIEEVAKGVDIVVATPGRFMDLYLNSNLVVKQIKTLVLDEADKMMDMGFMPQIRKILEIIPTKRQNLLFSATLPQKVEKLSEEFLEFPLKVEINPQSATAETVSQFVYKTPNLKTKINLLHHLLKDRERFIRVIVFVKKRLHAEEIFKFLQRMNLGEVRVIHANKGQNTRLNSISDFKDGAIRILVATDVASRGIDVLDVSHVINFDVPVVYEDYIHRIGRTGRALKTGEALTFISPPDEFHLEKIEKLIRQKITVLQIPAEVEIPKTPFIESQEMLRAIDNQKKLDNPDFKGAFHEKQKAPRSSKPKKNKGKRRY